MKASTIGWPLILLALMLLLTGGEVVLNLEAHRSYDVGSCRADNDTRAQVVSLLTEIIGANTNVAERIQQADILAFSMSPNGPLRPRSC